MTNSEFILQAVQANSPCTLKHVINQCKLHGFASGFVNNLHALKTNGSIFTQCEDGEIVVYLA